MSELLTGAEMRALEQAAIARGDVTGLELMERAGAGVVRTVLETWPGIWPELGQGAPRAVVLCGPGNNGGDGFVIARLLLARGWAVEVFLLGDPEKLPPDARANHDRWHALGAVRPLEETSLDGYLEAHPETALAVDALFGTGLTRPLRDLRGVQAVLSRWQAAAAPQVVAVDLPSGLCSDSGRYLGRDRDDPPASVVRANLTVSFHRPRLGHLLAEGPEACGALVVQDIGLAPSPEAVPGPARRVDAPPAETLAKGGGHKFSHGHAVVISGGFGKTGAARLAARGALRIGAGLVTLGVPGAAQMEVAGQITGLMMTRVEDGAALAALLEDGRITALCLGPGLGLDRARALVPVALDQAAERARPARGVVLDADALTAYRDDPEALFARLHARCVLTPHDGEFARLFPDLAARLGDTPHAGPAYSKADAARDAARRAGCVVVFKGPDTVIADPQGRVAVNAGVYDRAAPWLATAGTGDVLAGFVTGLLARGKAPMPAAQTAAWLHVACARHFGPGLISEDLPEALPAVLRAL